MEALRRENKNLSLEIKDITDQLSEGGKSAHELVGFHFILIKLCKISNHINNYKKSHIALNLKFFQFKFAEIYFLLNFGLFLYLRNC